MIVVLAPESESVMFNEMLAAGRSMAEPFRSASITRSPRAPPDVKLANTNCHNGRVLEADCELDHTGQDQLDELERAQHRDLHRAHRVHQARARLADARGHRPRDGQGDDPARPAAAAAAAAAGAGRADGAAPPAPPRPSLDQQVAIYEAELAYEAREAALVAALESCVVSDRASGTVCGLTANEAPILGSRSTACCAAATRRGRRGENCGYWDSDVNPLAADTDLRIELLEAGHAASRPTRARSWPARRTRRARSARSTT